jgi:hypothetical protein
MSKAVGNIAKIDYTDLYRYLASTGTIFVSLSYLGISAYLIASLTTDSSVKILQAILLILPMLVGFGLLYAGLFGIGRLDGWIEKQSTMDGKHEAHRDLIEKQAQAFEKKSDPQLPQEISSNIQDWSSNP